MTTHICSVCQYEYDPDIGDPDNGIAPGTSFEDLPDDWVCPVCGAEKEDFEANIQLTWTFKIIFLNFVRGNIKLFKTSSNYHNLMENLNVK